ncbi:S8 family peptidase [Halobiforma nitratireducens]|uniref:Peptidase S8 and S53 subtilisin kexin sedolisin n=1 Tax=Halobiforma nitratireducens JCM 10879 TaxID=1227454 RepID=M0MIQ4_9EURY|nr:S8 family serine peptidase [Halobiforma nitratireducens]EMA45243.1 peptidase S8 and S53 subtilisin kexin sedolisin [Halobiforma nitratireducens JCM 10879]
MQRRTFLTTLGATAAATTTPAFFGFSPSIGSPDAFTDFALAADDIDTFRDGYPGFVLRYEDADHRDSLEEWLEETETARIHRDLELVNMLAVNMSWADAGRTTTFGIDRYSGGLNDLEYLEYAAADAFLERPEYFEPSDLASQSDVDHGLGIGERLLTTSFGTDSTPDYDGLAFDGDAPTARLREARTLVQAGDSVLEEIDTSSVRVCVADTGVNDRWIYEDGEGESRISPESTDFTGGSDETGVDAVADGDGHGDWVSACILADHDEGHYTGFAPAAELIAAKTLGDDGSGSIADIVAGIELAIDTHADVLCMSLGSPQWAEPIADALADAWDAGVFPVAAVGNDRFATTFVAHPSSSEYAVGINATNVPDSGDRDDTQLSYFGNVGPHPGTQDFSDGESADAKPALAAPGMNIEIDPVGTLSGTSMAAPMVAGAAAVLAAEGYDNETILERLTDCAYPVENFGVTEAEHGLLDVDAALRGYEYEDSQEDVRNDGAEARDRFNRALSATRGGFW